MTLLVVNLPLLPHLGLIRESLGRALQSAAQGQRGIPHARYGGIFRDNSTPVMWALLIVFLAARWRERRRLPLVVWLLIAFPFACTLALSLLAKPNYRYFLPVSACLTFLAALGVLDAAKYLSHWMQVPLGARGDGRGAGDLTDSRMGDVRNRVSAGR